MIFNNKIKKYFKKNPDNLFYLSNYIVSKKNYNYFIIIPIYNEYDYILHTLDSINKNPTAYLKNLLVILVINNSIKDNKKIVNNNYRTHQLINNQQYKYEKLVIDCYSKGNELEEKQAGVGSARKIGMDYAVQFSAPQSLFCSLDADTLISKQYLNTVVEKFKKHKMHACVVNFNHQNSQNNFIEKAIRIYEKKIKIIANKIKNSGSPYGYVSMGSAMVCTASAYISVGGMSKRKATEDFYFLQALAKYSAIYQINNVLVYPSSRCEQRVHLGTGYRLNEFKINKRFSNLDYSPRAYKNLKQLIAISKKMWGQDYNLVYDKIQSTSDKETIDFLVKNNFESVWKKFCIETQNKIQFILFFNQWFDALKTIKFLKKLS